MFRPGFYPRGGGVVEVHIQPCPGLHGVSLHGPRAGEGDRFQRRRGAARIHRPPAGAAGGLPLASGGLGSRIPRGERGRAAPAACWRWNWTRRRRRRCFSAWRARQAGRARGRRGRRSGGRLPRRGRRFGRSAQRRSNRAAAGPGGGAVGLPHAEVTPHLTTNIAVIRRFLDRDIRLRGRRGRAGPGPHRLNGRMKRTDFGGRRP